MTRPDLVIFDCDGVLVDSEPITNRLLRDDLAMRGLDLSLRDVMSLAVGGTMRGVAARATKMGAEIPDDWVSGFYEIMYAALAEGTPLIDGVSAVLDQLDQADIPYCVGSNGSLEKMTITLGQHPSVFARLQGRMFSAHEHGTAKPDPDLYLIAARSYGIPPDRCAVIEDSPAGCTAARAAGMPCYGLAEHGDGARLAAMGAMVFHRMGKLPGLLGL